MASLIVKITYSGECFEIPDLNLKQITPIQVIDELVSAEILCPESELPKKRCDGSSGYYGVLDKSGCKINSHDDLADKPLCEYGFEDGDTLRIVTVGCCA